MKKFQIEESGWVGLEHDRSGWRGCCNAGLEAVTRRRVEEDEVKKKRAHAEESAGGRDSTATTKPFQCDMCKRTFRTWQDMAGHGRTQVCDDTSPGSGDETTTTIIVRRQSVLSPPLRGREASSPWVAFIFYFWSSGEFPTIHCGLHVSASLNSRHAAHS